MGKQDGDQSVYRQLIMLMMRAKRQMFKISEDWQLTPVQAMLVISLEPGTPRTMNELSEMMGCDASNVTGLTDRLEASGYIERITDEADRRVKKIRLTKKGASRRGEILDALKEAESIDADRLTQNEMKTLAKIVSKLV